MEALVAERKRSVSVAMTGRLVAELEKFVATAEALVAERNRLVSVAIAEVLAAVP